MNQQPTDKSQQISAYRWIIAWIVFGILIAAFNRLRVGKTVIYYLLVLTLLLLLLTQAHAIVSLLSPFSEVQAAQPQPSTATAGGEIQS